MLRSAQQLRKRDRAVLKQQSQQQNPSGAKSALPRVIFSPADRDFKFRVYYLAVHGPDVYEKDFASESPPKLASWPKKKTSAFYEWLRFHEDLVKRLETEPTRTEVLRDLDVSKDGLAAAKLDNLDKSRQLRLVFDQTFAGLELGQMKKIKVIMSPSFEQLREKIIQVVEEESIEGLGVAGKRNNTSLGTWVRNSGLQFLTSTELYDILKLKGKDFQDWVNTGFREYRKAQLESYKQHKIKRRLQQTVTQGEEAVATHEDSDTGSGNTSSEENCESAGVTHMSSAGHTAQPRRRSGNRTAPPSGSESESEPEGVANTDGVRLPQAVTRGGRRAVAGTGKHPRSPSTSASGQLHKQPRHRSNSVGSTIHVRRPKGPRTRSPSSEESEEESWSPLEDSASPRHHWSPHSRSGSLPASTRSVSPLDPIHFDASWSPGMTTFEEENSSDDKKTQRTQRSVAKVLQPGAWRRYRALREKRVLESPF